MLLFLALARSVAPLTCDARARLLFLWLTAFVLQRLRNENSSEVCTKIGKKDPGMAKQNSLATAATNFTKPGAQNKGDLCRSIFTNSWNFAYHLARS